VPAGATEGRVELRASPSAARTTRRVRLQAVSAALRAEQEFHITVGPARSAEDRLAEDGAAIRSRPDDPEGYLNRAHTNQHLGRHDQALADYDQAIRLDPRYAPAYKDRGFAHAAKKDYDRALADYD